MSCPTRNFLIALFGCNRTSPNNQQQQQQTHANDEMGMKNSKKSISVVT